MAAGIAELLSSIEVVGADTERLNMLGSAARNVHWQAVTGLQWIGHTLTTIECSESASREFLAGNGIVALGDLVRCLALLAEHASELEQEVDYVKNVTPAPAAKAAAR